MPMTRLTKEQLRKKKQFIADYIDAENAATGSKLDANANITRKNISTLSNELVKDIYIQINREVVADKIAETFGAEMAEQYRRDIDDHVIYVHDESSLFPYSYCGGESCVYRLGRDVVTMSFERLWNAAGGETEEPEPGVMVRFPEGLEVLDRDGRFTAVTRIVKKVRTRPLVEVKTRFGESIVVTDNHPMIVSDDADSTIPASECAGAKQLRTDAVRAATEAALRVGELDMRRELRDYDDMGGFVVSSTKYKRRDACKAAIRLDRDFGYVVGFFVAEGYYQKDGREKKGIFICQNDAAKLRDVASRLFASTGVPSYVVADRKLLVPSAAIARLFSETFGIGEGAASKSLPLGMLSYPEEFRLGLLAGLVDGDGCRKGNTATVATVSRTLASQLAYLIRSLGMSPSMLFQSAVTGQRIGGGAPVATARAVYKVSFPSTRDIGSDKLRDARAGSTRYESGWADVAKVSQLECGDTEPYVYDITTKSGTFMLNNLWVHNCVSVSMYPFLLDGLRPLGGESGAPQHLKSFVGGFINLVFAVSSQFAGAVATPEFLMYFDHFARRDFGDGYLRTHGKDIANFMQQVTYSLNQPAAARGYQCVTRDTELMTPDGWKRVDELSIGDECYAWSPNDDALRVERISAVNVQPFDGELVRMSGREYAQTVTGSHRVPYRRTDGADGYWTKTADELYGHSKLSLPIGSAGASVEDFPISDDMLKLCVAVLTDGSMESNGRTTIYCSPNRWLGRNLPRLLESNGIGYSVKRSTANLFGAVDAYRIPPIDGAAIARALKHTKSEIPHFMKLLSARQARIVVDTWCAIDGSSRRGNRYMQCDSEDIADALQIVAALAGYGTVKKLRKVRKINGAGFSEGWTVRLHERRCKRVGRFERVHYKGDVWCPTVPSGYVIFRESNGAPYISGNSVFWNVGIFDRPYFESLFGSFYFPNGDRPTWKGVNQLQQWFLSWLNAERTRALLTFPVVSIALLSDGQRPVDEEWAEVAAKEWSEGNQFFVYMSESVDSLSSCCFDGGETLRLFTDASGSRSVVMSMRDFVRQFGAGDIDRRLDTGAFIRRVSPDGAESIERIVGVLAKTHSGPMIRITVGGRTISVTPDHEFAAKLADTGEIVNVHAGEIAKDPEKYLLPTEF